MQAEEFTLTLSKPVTIGSADNPVVYEKLDLREPTAGELEKASLGNVTNIGVAINLISIVSGVPRKAIEKIGRSDLMAANNFLEGFSAGQSGAGAGQS